MFGYVSRTGLLVTCFMVIKYFLFQYGQRGKWKKGTKEKRGGERRQKVKLFHIFNQLQFLIGVNSRDIYCAFRI